MHNLILGKRNSGAQARILSTSALLAAHFDIDPVLVSSLKVQEKDAIVRAMKEREAVSDLLDAVAIKLNLIQPAPDPVPSAENETFAGVVTDETGDGETGDGLPEPVFEEKKSKRKQAAG